VKLSEMFEVDPVTLIRYDEIGLKGRNRRFFEGRLRVNLAGALGLPASAVRRERGRLFLEPPDERLPDEADLAVLARTFGVRSFSPGYRVSADLGRITEAVVTLVSPALERGATSFAVDSRRSEKAFPLTSLELNRVLGRAVQDRHPKLAVDLERPDFTLHVEVRRTGAYVYDAVHPGPGGLPVGTSGRGLLLLSGGIDSPVAGWMALKRGIAIDAVHFHTAPYTSSQARDKAVAIARELASWRGQPTRIYLVSITAAQQAIARSVPEKLWTVVLRRTMVRFAAGMGAQQRASVLITGDSLGQVASQTLENMAAVDQAAPLPILRPLVGFDKAEIVSQARRIGTFELSIQPFDDCCTLFSPRRPETRARLGEILNAERGLHLDTLLGQALESAEFVVLDPRPPRVAVSAHRGGTLGAF
jgi:thiamine biosynthesis protein ThiI